MIGTMVVVSAVLPSKAADLQREPGAVDQQADHDLRIDATFLRIADLAQVVFVFGLEIQRRHVVEQQAQPAAVSGMGEALLRRSASRYLPALILTR